MALDTSVNYQLVKKRKVIIYTFLQIIGILAIMILGGCFDFLNLRFEFTKITTWAYWNGVILQSMMYSIALVVGYIGTLQKEELKNEEYEVSMNLYHKYFLQKTESFGRFIDRIINPRIRTEYYHSSIERKLYLLEKKYKKNDQWKVEYDKAINWLLQDNKNLIQYYKVSDFIKNEKERKKCFKYIEKRYTLELLIEPSKIKENAKTFTKYPRINAHAFTWGIHVRERKNNGYKVENKTGRELSLAFGNKVLQVLLIAVVIGSIFADGSMNQLLEEVNGWIKLLIMYCIRVVMVCWNYISGRFMGKSMFESNYLNVVHNRNLILEEYINWKNKEKEEETEAFKLKKLAILESERNVDSEAKKTNNQQSYAEDVDTKIDYKKQVENLFHDAIK